jgi:Aldehyde dehydrogenase family
MQKRKGEQAAVHGHLKKVSLELGGKNSLIILDEADLDLDLDFEGLPAQQTLALADGSLRRRTLAAPITSSPIRTASRSPWTSAVSS